MGMRVFIKANLNVAGGKNSVPVFFGHFQWFNWER